jgi:hypothetical protein
LPDADDRMRAVTLGGGTFLDLVASGEQDIEEMRQLLAA